MRHPPSVSVIAVVLVATVITVACTGSPTSQSPDSPSSAELSPSASVSAASPSAETSTIVDRFREQVTDPEARWVAEIDGWFITAMNTELRSTSLYPVSGVLFFSGEDHHLVVAMPEPDGIRLFEQAGGRSSLLDAIRVSDLDVVGTETVDGRELTVLTAGTPIELAAFGDVGGAPGPEIGTIKILVDETGAPVRMQLSTLGSDGDVGPEVLTLELTTGDRGSPVPHGITWKSFESSRFGYAVDVPADFEQVAGAQFDTLKEEGYGGWDIRRYDLQGDSPATFFSGYLDFVATGAAQYGQPTNLEEYLTVGANDEGHGILATFHYETDGRQRVAFVSLFTKGDQAWDVTWRGLAEHEVSDRTMLLQMLTSWRFTTG